MSAAVPPRCPGCGVLAVLVIDGTRLVCPNCRWRRTIKGEITSECADCQQTVAVVPAAFQRCGKRLRRRRG